MDEVLMILSILLDENKETLLYLTKLKERERNFPLPLFTLKAYKTKIGVSRCMAILRIKILLPPLYAMGFLLLVMAFLFKSNLLFFFAWPFIFTSYFYSSSFFYMAFKKGLRKEGYTGMINYVPCRKALELVLNGTK
jgi:hypothetical protein